MKGEYVDERVEQGIAWRLLATNRHPKRGVQEWQAPTADRVKWTRSLLDGQAEYISRAALSIFGTSVFS